MTKWNTTLTASSQARRAPGLLRTPGSWGRTRIAAIAGAAAELWAAREQLVTALGPAALVDAAATVAIFNAVVRIADATGIPIEDYKVDLTAEDRARLGIDGYLEHRNG